ncbi:hypothetical protein AWC38_SpisGene7494 [Stylophora pistillata]|uniref:Reverse transcriptase domain-containing protein n=1 Tax=Stylophora pistillata TaxID=50429 RepID=A0A2B4SG64_STYPI|nr:hypothetical protein AWC38_SpisGene7494 [Stylophora pistillata]
MRVTKEDVIDASGSPQVCAGLRGGSKAAVYAMHSIFEEEETDATLLIDASNAFNALNRAAALHNIKVLCPPITTYAINTYRQPIRLFIAGGGELKSAEGTTQGDPLVMAIYAISLQSLITRLGISSDAKQCWYADDASGSGSLEAIKHSAISGFIIKRHNELRDLEADMLSVVCNDVEIEPVLQELIGVSLPSGANRPPDTRLDIHARGFCERQRSAFFDVRVCYPNADSYRDLDLKQIYKQHENEKKSLYTQRVMDVEQRTFTPLIFTTTGGMGEECKRYHDRLAELVAAKKGEDYDTTVS